jgi:hypothetical protein
MFLELTEALRCPAAHDESYVICAPVKMDGRDVVRGGLLCPVCRAEYAILDRVAWLAPPVPLSPAAPGPLTAEAAVTFLDLQGQGGFVVLVGNAGRLAPELAALLPGTGIACVNPPDGIEATESFSVVRSPHAWPVRRQAVRAVVVGADATGEPWLNAATGSVLNGLRMIVEDEAAEPAGMLELARGAGIFVGERRTR